MDKAIELLKESEQMIKELQDAYVSHGGATALRRKIRKFVNANQHSVQRTAEHAADCAIYVGMLGECDCGAEE